MEDCVQYSVRSLRISGTSVQVGKRSRRFSSFNQRRSKRYAQYFRLCVSRRHIDLLSLSPGSHSTRTPSPSAPAGESYFC